MRPDRSTPRIVALFRDRWQGTLAPRQMILNKLREDGFRLSQRTLEYALARAVDLGSVRVVKSSDGGALYGLRTYVEANPALVRSVQRMPLQSLQRVHPELVHEPGLQPVPKAVWRMLNRDARRGAHDLRAGHKCVACGYVPHFDLFRVDWPGWFGYSPPKPNDEPPLVSKSDQRRAKEQ